MKSNRTLRRRIGGEGEANSTNAVSLPVASENTFNVVPKAVLKASRFRKSGNNTAPRQSRFRKPPPINNSTRRNTEARRLAAELISRSTANNNSLSANISNSTRRNMAAFTARRKPRPKTPNNASQLTSLMLLSKYNNYEGITREIVVEFNSRMFL
jgi:hypothetical protein